MQFKKLVAAAFEAEPEQLCLIFAGKIMKDNDTLRAHNVKDGLTVHLVVKAPPRAEPEPSTADQRPPADVRQTPFGLNQFGGLAGMEALGAGSGTFMELQARMQSELMSNPDTMRTLLDNPLVQQMMNNPETMRSLITANPQMQDLMQRNPEISHMLNNPELLRQTMELARNPSMLQELMRSHDRAMSNLESVPGGYSALQRIYRDIQEPMMNAATDSFARNPFAGLSSGAGAGAAGAAEPNPQQGSENRDPLPNPWAPAGGAGGRAGAAAGAGASGAAPNVLNTPAMQSLMQQMSENPAIMQNLLDAPYTRTMMESMAADPAMAANVSVCLLCCLPTPRSSFRTVPLTLTFRPAAHQPESAAGQQSAAAGPDAHHDAAVPAADAEPRGAGNDDQSAGAERHHANSAGYGAAALGRSGPGEQHGHSGAFAGRRAAVGDHGDNDNAGQRHRRHAKSECGAGQSGAVQRLYVAHDERHGGAGRSGRNWRCGRCAAAAGGAVLVAAGAPLVDGLREPGGKHSG